MLLRVRIPYNMVALILLWLHWKDAPSPSTTGSLVLQPPSELPPEPQPQLQGSFHDQQNQNPAKKNINKNKGAQGGGTSNIQSKGNGQRQAQAKAQAQDVAVKENAIAKNNNSNSNNNPKKTSHCLVYFHVPKAGGTSMRSLLRIASQRKKWAWQSWYIERGAKDPAGETTKHDYIIHTGHITPQFLTLSGTQHCYRMTVLREPVSRVVSLFYYHKSKNLIPKDETFRSLLLEGGRNKDKKKPCRFCPEYSNEMTHVFSASETEAWSSQSSQQWGEQRPAAAEANSIQTSKDFLKTMDLVCFTNALEECQAKLGRLLNITLDMPFPTKNVLGSAKKNVVPEEDLDSIRRANQKDTEFYDWALDYFKG